VEAEIQPLSWMMAVLPVKIQEKKLIKLILKREKMS
jgi:hypothetical protein